MYESSGLEAKTLLAALRSLKSKEKIIIGIEVKNGVSSTDPQEQVDIQTAYLEQIVYESGSSAVVIGGIAYVRPHERPLAKNGTDFVLSTRVLDSNTLIAALKASRHHLTSSQNRLVNRIIDVGKDVGIARILDTRRPGYWNDEEGKLARPGLQTYFRDFQGAPQFLRELHPILCLVNEYYVGLSLRDAAAINGAMGKLFVHHPVYYITGNSATDVDVVLITTVSQCKAALRTLESTFEVQKSSGLHSKIP